MIAMEDRINEHFGRNEEEAKERAEALNTLILEKSADVTECVIALTVTAYSNEYVQVRKLCHVGWTNFAVKLRCISVFTQVSVIQLLFGVMKYSGAVWMCFKIVQGVLVRRPTPCAVSQVGNTAHMQLNKLKKEMDAESPHSKWMGF